MLRTIKNLLSSPFATFVLLGVYAASLALATWLEQAYGTETALRCVYHNPFFFFWQLLIVLNFFLLARGRHLLRRRRWGFLLVHAAFILMLAGALVTHLFGREGSLHLREGETADRILRDTPEGMAIEKLPFSIRLLRFKLERYPGSESPSSFESDVLVQFEGKSFERRISMNKVLDLKGYRFFQSSYDADERGSLLSVSYDRAGRSISYTGYLLLALGFLFFFFGKDSRFRRLSRRLKAMKAETAALPLLFCCLLAASATARAEGMPRPLVPPEALAARFGALPMQAWNGRIQPVETFASEVLRKLHQSESIDGFNANGFLLSLLASPEAWQGRPLIALSDKSLASAFGLKPGYCAYASLFDAQGRYKLTARLTAAYALSPARRSRFDKDLLKLDGQANLLYSLFHGGLLRLFPREAADGRWYAPDELAAFSKADSARAGALLPALFKALEAADTAAAETALQQIRTYQAARSGTAVNAHKLAAELVYNRLNPFRTCKTGYLVLGALLLALGFADLYRPPKAMKKLRLFLSVAVLLVFLFQTAGMGLRWYIGGYAPWSNSYETMVYVAWASLLGGLLFARRSLLPFGLATLFGGIVLFVAGLNWMDPQIGRLVPVLRSPWLMFHVAVIVAAYGFFGLSFLLGLTNLGLLAGSRKRPALAFKAEELSLINEMSLWIGLALMSVGTFLGAVWANESWGSYWSWDPKETWALITLVAYALVLHLRLVKGWDNPRALNWGAVWAFATVLMTYFGVNYFLTGMHAYAG